MPTASSSTPTLSLRSLALALGLESALLVAIGTIPTRAAEDGPRRITVQSQLHEVVEQVTAVPEEERERLPEITPEPDSPEIPEPEPIDYPLPPVDDALEHALEPRPDRLAEHALDPLRKKHVPPTQASEAVAKLTPTKPEVPVPPKPQETASTPEPLDGFNKPPRYPKRARQLQLEGQVKFEFVLDRDGRVDELVLVQSSGSRLLDLAARRALQKWRFDRGPARFPWTITFALDDVATRG